MLARMEVMLARMEVTKANSAGTKLHYYNEEMFPQPIPVSGPLFEQTDLHGCDSLKSSDLKATLSVCTNVICGELLQRKSQFGKKLLFVTIH